MKIVIVGNCQIAFIGERIREGLPKNSQIYIPKPVHLISAEEVLELHSRVKCADILIIQPIGDEYRDSLGLGTRFLSGLLPTDAQSIIFPNLYFGGFFPTFGYLRDLNNEIILARDDVWKGCNLPFSDYHDYLMLVAVEHGLNADEFYNMVTNSLPAEEKQRLFNESYNELGRRDEICDVKATAILPMSVMLPENFHSFNHPSNSLMDLFVGNILNQLGFPDIKLSKASVEALYNPKLPAYPFLFDTNVEFSKNDIMTNFNFYKALYCDLDFKERTSYSFPKEYDVAKKLFGLAYVK